MDLQKTKREFYKISKPLSKEKSHFKKDKENTSHNQKKNMHLSANSLMIISNKTINSKNNRLNIDRAMNSKTKLSKKDSREYEFNSKGLHDLTKLRIKKYFMNDPNNFNSFLKLIGNNKNTKTNHYSLSEFLGSDNTKVKNIETNTQKIATKINLKEFNSLCSYDNSIITTNNSSDETIYNNTIRRFGLDNEVIPKNVKNNIRLYSIPQMILVEDCMDNADEKILKTKVNKLKIPKMNQEKMKEQLSQQLKLSSKILKPTRNKRNNNQNYQIGEDYNRIFSSITLEDKYKYIDHIVYKDITSSIVKDELITKTTSDDNIEIDMVNKNGRYRKKNLVMKNSKQKDKHELHKKMQQTLGNVKLPKELNSNDKEQEYDKLFSLCEISKDSLLPTDENNKHFCRSLSRPGKEDNNESGILSLDQVKDLQICYDFNNYNIKDRNLFYKNDYKIFASSLKQKYIRSLLKGSNVVKENINMSSSSKYSSSNKKKYVIKDD